jgi:hypothetical protein
MSQPTLFDALAATKARDKALEQVERNADPLWKRNAWSVLLMFARTGDTFTTDDVWEYMNKHGMETPHEPRAMGAVMVKACRRKIIEPTDRYVKSQRPECHRRPIRVWQGVTVSADAWGQP